MSSSPLVLCVPARVQMLLMFSTPKNTRQLLHPLHKLWFQGIKRLSQSSTLLLFSPVSFTHVYHRSSILSNIILYLFAPIQLPKCFSKSGLEIIFPTKISTIIMASGVCIRVFVHLSVHLSVLSVRLSSARDWGKKNIFLPVSL